MAFVGDSLGRQQAVSLRCMLEQHGFNTSTANSEYVYANFVRDRTGPDEKGRYNISDGFDTWWGKVFDTEGGKAKYDYIVVNGGAWYTDKTLPGTAEEEYSTTIRVFADRIAQAGLTTDRYIFLSFFLSFFLTGIYISFFLS